VIARLFWQRLRDVERKPSAQRVDSGYTDPYLRLLETLGAPRNAPRTA